MRGGVGQAEGQRGAVYVGSLQLAGEQRVLVRFNRCIDRHRRVVNRVDRDRHLRRGAQLSVAHAVTEDIRAVEVLTGRIAEAAIGIQREAAMQRPATDKNCAQHIPVHIAVVTQHARSGDRQDRVFVRSICVGARNRRIVHRVDGDRYRSGVRIQRSIVGREAETVGAAEVAVRRVAEGAVRVEREDAVFRAVDQTEGQHRAFDIQGG